MTGYPSSGKSHRTNELKEFFIQRGKNVKIVSENVAIPKAGFQKNEYFADSQKEKIVRADLKSEAVRLLSKDDVVILDAGNYIKGILIRISLHSSAPLKHWIRSRLTAGYRYELYCASKAARTTQCTLFCAISADNAWTFNQQRQSDDTIDVNDANDAEMPSLSNSSVPYTREIFDALILRYEEPISNNRWDSPLFTVIADMQMNKDDIFAALFEKKPPPPNQSTQNVSKNSK